MLADTESEKNKWIVALSELHRILKRNNLPNTTVVRVQIILLKFMFLSKIFIVFINLDI